MLKISKKVENTGTAGKKSAFPITILQDIRAKKNQKNQKYATMEKFDKSDEPDCNFK